MNSTNLDRELNVDHFLHHLIKDKNMQYGESVNGNRAGNRTIESSANIQFTFMIQYWRTRHKWHLWNNNLDLCITKLMCASTKTEKNEEVKMAQVLVDRAGL